MRVRNEDFSFGKTFSSSGKTVKVYTARLNSWVVKEAIAQFGDFNSILDIQDISILEKVHSIVKKHPVNQASHYSYSAAIKKYIIYFISKEEAN